MTVLQWDEGTAYDLFVSLYVLHRPQHSVYAPPGLPVAQRDFLEKVQSFLPVPLSWLYLLPAEAKNAAGALNVLAQLPAAERLPSPLSSLTPPSKSSTQYKLSPCARFGLRPSKRYSERFSSMEKTNQVKHTSQCA